MLKSLVFMLSLLLCDNGPSSSWTPSSNYEHQIFFSSATSPKALDFHQLLRGSCTIVSVWEESLALGIEHSACSCVSRTGKEPLKFIANGCGILNGKQESKFSWCSNIFSRFFCWMFFIQNLSKRLCMMQNLRISKCWHFPLENNPVYICTSNNWHFSATDWRPLYHQRYRDPIASIMTLSSIFFEQNLCLRAIAVKWLRKISLGNPTPQEPVEMLIFNLLPYFGL